MHHFEYYKKSKKVLQHALDRYPWLFDQGYSKESIEVRYHLLDYLMKQHQCTGKLEKDIDGKTLPIMSADGPIYWSVSHTDQYVAFIVGSQPTGIDIIEREKRDISLLDLHSDLEYRILGKKNWKNFGVLWSAKECIIKLSGWKLDDMKLIHLLEKDTDENLIFAFHQKKYTIHAQVLDAVIISYII